jgi:hypothetical protein
VSIFPSYTFGLPFFPRVSALVEIIEYGIASEPADEVESGLHQTIGEVKGGEIGVSHDVSGVLDESVSEIQYCSEIPMK